MDIWGIWGRCGVLGHHGVTEGNIKGIFGGYLGDMGSLWGRYGDVRSLGRMWGCHRAIWGHKGGRKGGYRGDMGTLWATMGSLGGY